MSTLEVKTAGEYASWKVIFDALPKVEGRVLIPLKDGAKLELQDGPGKEEITLEILKANPGILWQGICNPRGTTTYLGTRPASLDKLREAILAREQSRNSTSTVNELKLPPREPVIAEQANQAEVRLSKKVAFVSFSEAWDYLNALLERSRSGQVLIGVSSQSPLTITRPNRDKPFYDFISVERSRTEAATEGGSVKVVDFFQLYKPGMPKTPRSTEQATNSYIHPAKQLVERQDSPELLVDWLNATI